MNTRDMTKKRQRKLGSTESSSSGEMVISKPSKDVLGLGRHLVRELRFEDGVDTLGRWMAHHLAELIDEAESGSTPAERLRARKSATETILKIWEHRASLPGRSVSARALQRCSEGSKSTAAFGQSVPVFWA